MQNQEKEIDRFLDYVWATAPPPENDGLNSLLPVSPFVRKEIIKKAFPSLHKLYVAVWSAGYTVNGIKP